jgi:hypothetical protein
MSMHVLVEPLPDGSGYRASTGAPLDLSATGKTPDEALDEIGRKLADRWARGARLYPIPSWPITRRPDPALSAEDAAEVERLYQEALEEHRSRSDREAEAEYGVTIDRPAR